MIQAIIAGLIAFILFLVFHVVIFRAIELKERFKALTYIFYAFAAGYVIIYLLLPGGYLVVAPIGSGPAKLWLSVETVFRLTRIINFLAGFMLYVFLFLGYCQFYFIVDRSISVRVMIEIEKSPDKRLTYEQIRDIYSFDQIFRRRLGHMTEGGYLTEESGYYVNTKKGRAEARLFAFIKDFLRLGRGG